MTNGFDDFWVRDMRNGFDGAISLSLFVFARLSPSFSLSLFAHCSMNKLGLGFSGLVRALGCGSILPSSVLGCWCDLSSVLSLFLSSIFLGRK